MTEPWMITRAEANKVLRKSGSEIPSWVVWDETHPDWQLTHAAGVKALKWVQEHSEQIYERQWVGDDFVAIDYYRIKKSDLGAALKAGRMP